MNSALPASPDPAAADWKAQLAGLHAPPPPSAWPPSGWVLLLVALTLAALAVLAIWAFRRWRAAAWKRQALRELTALSTASDPVVLSTLLRRVARHRHGAPQAALGDSAFAAFLCRSSGDRIPADVALRLATCAHRPEAMLESRDLEAAGLWIRTC